MSLHPKRHINQFSCFSQLTHMCPTCVCVYVCSVYTQTHRPTLHATFVAKGRNITQHAMILANMHSQTGA